MLYLVRPIGKEHPMPDLDPALLSAEDMLAAYARLQLISTVLVVLVVVSAS